VVSYISVTVSEFRGFLWHNGTMTDLNSMVPPGSGLIFNAEDINDSRQIVGRP